jgi:hypothetical protein
MAEACGVNRSTVQRIAKEGNAQNNSNGNVSFSSYCKTNNGTTVTDTNNFGKNILRKRVMSYYNTGQYPTLMHNRSPMVVVQGLIKTHPLFLHSSYTTEAITDMQNLIEISGHKTSLW